MKKKKKSEIISIEEESVTIEKEEVIIMNELIPIGYQVNDDMKKIADMTDEFSQTIDPILRIYNAAMNATTARLDIIEDEFKFRRVRNPIHHIDNGYRSLHIVIRIPVYFMNKILEDREI